ncbi:hypothetical protein [Spirosoma areae]
MKNLMLSGMHTAAACEGVTSSRFGKKLISATPWTTLLTLALLLVGMSCQPGDGVRPGDYGSGPRKPVPAEMVGEWMYTSVSGTNIVSRNGHTVPAWSLGSVYHINADGTGWSIVTASTNTYTSEDTQRIEENGTYEIDLDDNGDMQFKFYPANGKVYNNDVFAHDVESAKLYPQTSVNWFCSLTTINGKTCFESGELRYYKTK